MSDGNEKLPLLHKTLMQEIPGCPIGQLDFIGGTFLRSKLPPEALQDVIHTFRTRLLEEGATSTQMLKMLEERLKEEAATADAKVAGTTPTLEEIENAPSKEDLICLAQRFEVITREIQLAFEKKVRRLKFNNIDATEVLHALPT